MRLAAPILLAAAVAARDTLHESLTLHPLPDGKLSVLFEFTTQFDLHHGEGSTHQSHHALTPPGLLLPLERNNVSELTVSFTSGQWHARRHGEAGPLAYEAGGGGGSVRGWLRGAPAETDAAWDAVTHAFGGMFCAGVVGAEDSGKAIRTFGELYPPAHDGENASHYLVSTPHLHLCTENLTPFLSLLPSKGLSGLSALLAKPGVVLSWGFKTEGIDVVMPTADAPGSWRGWWEGVVDLVPMRNDARDFTIHKLFQQLVPRPFPAASSSVIRVVRPRGEHFSSDPAPARSVKQWMDGRQRVVDEWDLADVSGRDMGFWWDGEGHFQHPLSFEPPFVTISRVAADRNAADATLVIDITNNADVDRPVVYSEVWPWWVKGWMSEMTVRVDGKDKRGLLRGVEYMPSVPPTPSTTTLHLHLTLPAHSVLRVSIPFTKLTLKYDDHRPDAERGREIPPGVLTLLDIEGEDGEDGEGDGDVDHRRSSRRHVYAAKLLLDVPTPDFSMPYNVIIMSSTVMAVFFGSLQGRLVRRWGWVEIEPTPEEAATEQEQVPEAEPLFPRGEKVSYDMLEEDLNANDTDSDAEEAG
ncbi:hypothetical protein CcaverHIS002_0505430 [Cutaneotrichosporon cavernicola]|uniref:Gpi16 subunit, GPI transamidase component n=1 Tax=Cutaneotrichosporon cavernicola TaxID=279322 RepID=A0AA48L6P9_9TREE|nr:uncharacterized protein CcaverHIS019_0505950 [Cutaneotrichosporon cavernicola]BEI85142.1 hypothetical protein CcaverHIS002_0505430 [Cutaneotrichosporon cavernicola]BEI92967.1 hypothetical protein CcaverHIS019_0505950 [Cutaneotrichosporon cavernicola]BEJ00743.1 hypothetical protein CcaverHIS631_0506000 [Cutaneotrichosporon cavernicola]BEJ08509.1 hypothetical protein CcaverHIS641_0506030 [Cutaneotrichosporon cavernicola]